MRPKPIVNPHQSKISVQDVPNKGAEWSHENEEMRRIQVSVNQLIDKIEKPNAANEPKRGSMATTGGQTSTGGDTTGSGSSKQELSVLDTGEYVSTVIARELNFIDTARPSPELINIPIGINWDLRRIELTKDERDRVDIEATAIARKSDFYFDQTHYHHYYAKTFVDHEIVNSEIDGRLPDRLSVYKFRIGNIAEMAPTLRLSPDWKVRKVIIDVKEPFAFEDSGGAPVTNARFSIGFDTFEGGYRQQVLPENVFDLKTVGSYSYDTNQDVHWLYENTDDISDDIPYDGEPWTNELYFYWWNDAVATNCSAGEVDITIEF